MARTPGPWRVWDETTVWQDSEPKDSSSYSLVKLLAEAYAGGRGRDYISREEATANARLIAAAPDLLVALKEARDFIQIKRDQSLRCSDGISASEADARLQQMDAAIAKAEGCSDAPAHD